MHFTNAPIVTPNRGQYQFQMIKLMSINEWRHKDVWTKNPASGDGFAIEVVRFTSKPYLRNEYLRNEGENKWCVYVYVYPQHPLFKKINPTVGDTITCYDDRLPNMPLHGGCTYTQIHLTDDGKEITSIQIGADYSHYRDERYSFMATKEDAFDVFFDAEQLYKWMQNYDGNDKENTDVM
jgi:hypothetical protein